MNTMMGMMKKSADASAALPIRNAEISAVIPDFLSFGNDEYLSSSQRVLKQSDRVGETLQPSGNKEAVAAALDSNKKTITVLISGTSFLVDQPIFAKLKDLPWAKSGDNFSLLAAPELFEIILNYLLFSTLPDAKQLSQHDKDELGAMARLLNLQPLLDHLAARSSFRNSFRRQASSVSQNKTEKAAPTTAVNNKENNYTFGAGIKLTTSEDTAPTVDEGSSGTVSPLPSPVSVEGSTKNNNQRGSTNNNKPPKADNVTSAGALRGSFKRAFSLRGSMSKRNSSKSSVRSSGSQRTLAEEEWYSDIVA